MGEQLEQQIAELEQLEDSEDEDGEDEEPGDAPVPVHAPTEVAAAKKAVQVKEPPKPPIQLREFARLDTMVTVVDCVTFFARLHKMELVRDQPDAEGDEEEERTLSNLMVEQVEF